MLLSLALVGTARADGPSVDETGGDIGTSIYSGGAPGSAAPGSGGDSGLADGAGSGLRCDYLPRPQLDEAGPPIQHAYLYQCEDGSTGYVLVPTGASPDAVPQVTPGQLAQQVYNRLQLPKPVVGLNPPYAEPGRFQIVNFPIWWWVENFQPLTQRTELGTVWAEVTATPVFSVFDGGEGAGGARCNGPGVAWRLNLPDDYRLACTYSYRRAAERVTATITVTWNVTWVGSGGTGGQLDPMQLATPVPLTVYERQTVNVPFGS